LRSAPPPSSQTTMRRKAKVGLSGGQWQRLALSRLFMRGTTSSSSSSSSTTPTAPAPSLILLDEASSQLDATAEHSVFARLRRRFPNATIVFITHRLETVRWADKVAFFEGGRITEFGRHEDLCAVNSSGGYRAMWRAFQGGDSSSGGSAVGADDDDADAGDGGRG